MPLFYGYIPCENSSCYWDVLFTSHRQKIQSNLIKVELAKQYSMGKTIRRQGNDQLHTTDMEEMKIVLFSSLFNLPTVRKLRLLIVTSDFAVSVGQIQVIVVEGIFLCFSSLFRSFSACLRFSLFSASFNL